MDIKDAMQIISQVENAELDRMNFVNVNGKELPLATELLTGKYCFNDKEKRGYKMISDSPGRRPLGWALPEIQEYIKAPVAKFPEREINGAQVAFDYIEERSSKGVDFKGIGSWGLLILVAAGLFFAGALVSNLMNTPPAPLPPQKLERPVINNNSTLPQRQEQELQQKLLIEIPKSDLYPNSERITR